MENHPLLHLATDKTDRNAATGLLIYGCPRVIGLGLSIPINTLRIIAFSFSNHAPDNACACRHPAWTWPGSKTSSML